MSAGIRKQKMRGRERERKRERERQAETETETEEESDRDSANNERERVCVFLSLCVCVCVSFALSSVCEGERACKVPGLEIKNNEQKAENRKQKAERGTCSAVGNTFLPNDRICSKTASNSSAFAGQWSFCGCAGAAGGVCGKRPTGEGSDIGKEVVNHSG